MTHRSFEKECAAHRHTETKTLDRDIFYNSSATIQNVIANNPTEL